MLVLNPDTTDLIDRLSVAAPDGVRLVVMGGVRQAGGGCLCPETALISSAVAGMHLHDDDVVLMDTHAGVEHFGRALARGFDSRVVVVEPTFNAVQVGLSSRQRSPVDLGIETIHLVVNRARSEQDLGRALDYVDQSAAPVFDSVTSVPYRRAGAARGALGRRSCSTAPRWRTPSSSWPPRLVAPVHRGAGCGDPDARRRHRHRARRASPPPRPSAGSIPTGTVVALSAEPFAPYSPPAMADHYLTGRDETLYWKGEDVATRLGIDERREATGAAIDADNHEVVLADGQRVPYEGWSSPRGAACTHRWRAPISPGCLTSSRSGRRTSWSAGCAAATRRPRSLWATASSASSSRCSWPISAST